MTKVARHKIAKAMASETPIKKGVIVTSPRCFWAFRRPCGPPWATRLAPPNRTTSNPRKISNRQPARSARGPRKSDLMPDAGWGTLTGAVDSSAYQRPPIDLEVSFSFSCGTAAVKESRTHSAGTTLSPALRALNRPYSGSLRRAENITRDHPFQNADMS